MLAEAAIYCVIGGLIGLVLATLAGMGISKAVFALPITVDHTVWRVGLGSIVGLTLTVGLLPALRASRLTIVDALAGR